MTTYKAALEPTANVSSQRLSDQVRYIQRRKVLTDEALERLRTDLCVVQETITPVNAQQAVNTSIPAADVELEDNLDNIVSPHDEQRLRGALEGAMFIRFFTAQPSRHVEWIM
ncbi:hypothetical protein O3G_MSEX013274 [Manduca sexta]|uniref:Uncharacterized protein n=1 Tax=Manduca sexta TaxID=7130 RepID=A0A921ZS51_MANSE|nr:hypothetical protein O3G_MSEX013274 [Manduca sexta]